MLGDGIVSFGTAVETVSARKRKSSPKIVSETETLPVTWCWAGVNSMSPPALWKRTAMSPASFVTPSSR